MIHCTITYHELINAQPTHEQQLSFPDRLPQFLYWAWCCMEHPSGQFQSPPLAMLLPCFLNIWSPTEHGKMKSPWFSTIEQPLKHQCVINIIFTLHPNHCTGPATKKKINSKPHETRTGKGTASRHSTGKWSSSSFQEPCGCAHHPNVCLKGSKVRFQEGRGWIRLLCSYHYYGLFCINNNPLLPFYSRCNKLFFYERLVPQLCFCISSARAAVHYFVYFKAAEIITKTDIKTCGGVSNHFSSGKTDSFALLKYCKMFKYFFDKCSVLTVFPVTSVWCLGSSCFPSAGLGDVRGLQENPGVGFNRSQDSCYWEHSTWTPKSRFYSCLPVSLCMSHTGPATSDSMILEVFYNLNDHMV